MTANAVHPGRITIPGTDVGVKGTLVAEPQTTDMLLTLDDRLALGPVKVDTDPSGTLETPGLVVPIVGGVVWLLRFEPHRHDVPPFSLGVYNLNTSGVDLKDLVVTEVTGITETDRLNIAAAIAAGAGNDSATSGFVANDASATRSQMDKRFARALSPLAYGAVGNGTTNDYTALAATISAAASGGKVVDLGGLTYKFNSRIIVPAGVTIRNGGLTTALSTTGEQGAIDVNAGDIHFENVAFSFGASAKFGVFADQAGATKITIRGGTATGAFSHAFAFNDKVTDSEITGVTFTSVVSGVRVRGDCRRIKVNNNIISGWLTYGFEVRGVSGVGAPSQIETNGNRGSNPTTGDPNTAGVARQLVRYLGASDAITTDAECNRNWCQGPALAFNPGTNNNATGDQIGMQYVDRFFCNDNTMINGGENGISITDGCTNGEVAGNNVTGSDGHGIQVSRVGFQATNITVHHNICWNNNMDRAVNNGGLCAGIFLQDSISCTAHTNRCYDNQTPKKQNSGIFVSTATDLSLFSNDLAGNLTTRLSEQGTRTYKRKEDGDTYTHGDGVGAPIIRLNGAATQRREIRWQSNGVDRWRFLTGTVAEGGSNTGSQFTIDAMSDDGSTATNAATITRATGAWTVPAMTVTGTLTAGGLAISGIPFGFAEKGSAQTWNNDTTLATITGLSASVVANAYTEVTFTLIYDSSTAADFKVKPQFSSTGHTFSWYAVGASTAVNAANGLGTGIWLAGDNSTASLSVGGANVGASLAAVVTVRIKTGANAGTVTLQGAQAAADATVTTVAATSTVEAVRKS